jgi:CBS domain-containing protein
MKAVNVMTSNLVAAREGSTAREIGTKLLIGNFNGLPVINSSIKVIGIVTGSRYPPGYKTRQEP